MPLCFLNVNSCRANLYLQNVTANQANEQNMQIVDGKFSANIK